MNLALSASSSLLTLSMSAAAFPTTSRMADIQQVAIQLDIGSLYERISIVQDDTLSGPAIVHKIDDGYRLTYNQKILSTLPLSAQKLITYHELGHIALGHSDMDPRLKDRAQVEFEADTFAAFLFMRLQIPDRELFQFIDFISTQVQTVPPGPKRAQLFRSIFEGSFFLFPTRLVNFRSFSR